TGTLQGYNVSVQGATFDDGSTERVFGADGYVTQITIGEDAQAVGASYSAICATDSGQRNSAAASMSPVQTVSSEPTPSPSPSEQPGNGNSQGNGNGAQGNDQP